MDISKAKRLLAKINVIVDNFDGAYTKLETDLLKNYTEELFQTFGGHSMRKETLQAPTTTTPPPPPKVLDNELSKSYDYQKPTKEKEQKPLVEFDDIPTPSIPIKEEKMSQPLVDFTSEKEVEEVIAQEKLAELPKKESYAADEEVKESKNGTTTVAVDSELDELFMIKTADDLMSKLSEKPITKIEAAMGINERILTVNDLFGSDSLLFSETLKTLNEMNSFEDAKSYLMKGVATKYKWSDPDRKGKAIHFIRIVWRKYAQKS